MKALWVFAMIISIILFLVGIVSYIWIGSSKNMIVSVPIAISCITIVITFVLLIGSSFYLQDKGKPGCYYTWE